MKNLSTLLILFLFSLQLTATHNRAGEIIVRQTGNLTVEATVITYTKASSTPADRDSLYINWGDGLIERIGRTNGNGDGEYLENDTKLNMYTFSHTYFSVGQFTISMLDPNRNAGILNVNFPNSDNVAFYIETTFTVLGSWANNNSPVLLEPAVDVAFVGEPFIHVPNAFDADGDSVAYELKIPLANNGDEVPGYVDVTEIGPGPNNTLTLDEETGVLIWDSPQIEGEYNFALLIRSFRNGVEIESIIRDMQIVVYDEFELMPDIVQLNAPGNNDVVQVSVGDTISLNFEITEPQTGQELWISSSCGLYDYFNQPATFTYSVNGATATAHFEWIVREEHQRQQPYLIVIKAKGVNNEVGLANYLVLSYRTDYTVGIHTPKKELLDFSLSPNPATNDFVNLNISTDDISNMQYQVYNTLGISTRQGKVDQKMSTIDISDLPAGWYSIHVENEKYTGSQLFFIP